MLVLPIRGKILEKLFFKSIFEYHEEKKLLSAHQSGFWSSDSCVNQLLSIIHNLHEVFDAYPTLETCGVFLDMSMVFEKVWHKELIVKLNSVGVSDFVKVLMKVSQVTDSRECC